MSLASLFNQKHKIPAVEENDEHETMKLASSDDNNDVHTNENQGEIIKITDSEALFANVKYEENKASINIMENILADITKVSPLVNQQEETIVVEEDNTVITNVQNNNELFSSFDNMANSKKIRDLTLTNRDLTNKINELTKKIETLNPDAIQEIEDKYIDAINDLNITMNAKNNEIEQLRTENSELRKINLGKLGNKKENDYRIVQLNRKLEESQKQCEELQKKIDESKDASDEEHQAVQLELQKTLEHLQAEKDIVKTLQSQLNTVSTSETNALRQRVSNLSNTINQLSQQNRVLIHRLSYSGI